MGESYWAVRRLLEEGWRRTRPVALVLDDVHWAEPALLDLVEYLRDRATAPLLALCLARPELLDDRPSWAADTLRLEPLADDETLELVDETAELERDARWRIVELAEGNPPTRSSSRRSRPSRGRRSSRGRCRPRSMPCSRAASRGWTWASA